jgi:hypothetical protein
MNRRLREILVVCRGRKEGKNFKGLVYEQLLTKNIKR